MAKKRVVVISDLHCGHRVGLTPPDYQSQVVGGSSQALSKKFYYIQVELWDRYVRAIKKLQPIDLLIVNGDCIDGRGKRSGSTELIQVDRNKQVDMAVQCIKEANAQNIVIVRGTPYHVGKKEEFEDSIARQVGALKIEDHGWYDVNGLIFDVKHKVGSSSIPHGRATPLSKEALWNLIWAERDEQPRADILIRSHVHYFEYRGDSSVLCMTTPALQGMGSKYGAKECSGTVDWGFVWFDVREGGRYSWNRYVVRVESQKAKALKL